MNQEEHICIFKSRGRTPAAQNLLPQPEFLEEDPCLKLSVELK